LTFSFCLSAMFFVTHVMHSDILQAFSKRETSRLDRKWNVVYVFGTLTLKGTSPQEKGVTCTFQCLLCTIQVSFFCPSSGGFSDPVNYRCNCWIPVFGKSFVALACVLVNDKPGILLSRLESVPLFVNHLYARRIQTIKHFQHLSASSPLLIRIYKTLDQRQSYKTAASL
jgi:hypothetical protein